MSEKKSVSLSPMEVVTPPVRLAFPALFQPKPVMKGSADLKFMATLLIPPDLVWPDGQKGLAPLFARLTAAKNEKWGTESVIPKKNNPIKSCDDKPDLDGYEPGWFYLNTKSGYQPSVLDQRKNEVLDPERVYAGCWCRFHLVAYAWDHPTGGRGVSFSLNAVQLVKDGERLGGRAPATEVFDAIDVPDDAMPDAKAKKSADDDAAALFGA